ncbi:MAG: LysR family transcriptional regulator [Paracoccaceae bacterium]
MRYFVIALKLSSISRAAETLNVAPSAIASAIDQIEAHFQLQLTTRKRAKGIEPTSAGRDMSRKFEHLLEEYDAVLSDGRELQQGLSGSLRIGYYAPVAPAFLPEILRDILTPDGNVQVSLEECHNSEAQTGLSEGRFDVILFVPDGTQPHIEYEPLLRAPAYVLLPQHHPLTQRDALHLSDLASERLVALNRPMVTEYHQNLFAALGQQPEIVAQADTTEMVRSLVGSGLGCAILNMRPATDQSYAGDSLETRPILDAGTSLTLAIGYNKKSPRRVVEFFVNRCLAWANSDAPRRFIVLP